MKQRYLEVKKCKARMLSELQALGMNIELEFKQLYHDREEVTGHLRVHR
jgi:23S rRNA (cytidine2498-2'-O)-methyltransferase